MENKQGTTMTSNSDTKKSFDLEDLSNSANLTGYKFTPYQPKKNETYMSENQSDHFHKILDNWKQELMKEVDQTINDLKNSSTPADPNDRATQEETFTLELRIGDRERKLIKIIGKALRLIDEGEYGYCESCGVEIGLRRLEARPTAFLCIDCKTLDEIREKRK